MKIGKAFLAGVMGGVATTVLLAIVRGAGVPVNLEEVMGSMITGSLGPSAFSVGFILHLVLSGLIGLLYAAGFEYGTRRADWLTGVAFSLVHTLLAGLFTIVLPLVHPLMPTQVPPPGPFMAGLGLTGVAVFILIHLVYGAIVGAIYGPIEEQLDDPLEDPLYPRCD